MFVIQISDVSYQVSTPEEGSDDPKIWEIKSECIDLTYSVFVYSVLTYVVLTFVVLTHFNTKPFNRCSFNMF